MQPVLSPKDEIESTKTNGYIKHEEINGKPLNAVQETTTTMTSNNDNEEKVVLPVEMASMVPLKALIGKLIHKAHADLITLTETLPSMSEVEKKRQILTYTTFVRKQFLKLLVLVKWAENANDMQMCQNIMAFLANQNQIFTSTVDFLHKIYTELPAARLRNFDIPTAVDVLTTGTYQRMPTKIKDMLTPTPLTDEEVLETFQNMNDVIRMRMVTTEVLPSPMRKYRIGKYLFLDNEFEVALTLMGHSNDRRWWIVSLDVFIQATSVGGASEDVDISLNDNQKQHLRVNAQKQLVPPNPDEPTKLFFPLVNMYDYLHLCCLNMQLEILYIQAAMLSKTRWMNQLKVQMNQDRTKLTVVYWRGGSPASHWARPQAHSKGIKSTVLEISVSHPDQQPQPENVAVAVRDELKGLVQKAGIGASIALSDLSANEQARVLSSLKYPKNCLDVLWDDNANLHTERKLLDSANLNLEQLVLHVTNYHGKCIIDKFRELLNSQKDFLEENGLHLAEEENREGSQLTLVDGNVATKKLTDAPCLLTIEILEPSDSTPSLVVRYRHQKYISIECDARTGRVKASETGDGCSEGDFKLRGLEDKLNNDPQDIARHLLWLRSEVVVREVIALAKQLNLQPYHPSQMNLRPEDLQKLFGDVLSDATTSATTSTTAIASTGNSKYPSHCMFLQFSQFEDWYFIIATVKNEFKAWLCCINKTYDQNGLYQAIVDLAHFDCNQVWKDQFAEKLPTASKNIEDAYTSTTNTNTHKRKIEAGEEDAPSITHEGIKRRRMSMRRDESEAVSLTKIDNLSIDLRFLAKLDSLCRAYITNRMIELQLQSFKGSLKYHMRPLLQSLSSMETQVMNHPAADKMEVVCVSQRDLLKTCAYHFAEDGSKREKPIETIPWIERLLPSLKNDVLIRSFGWWDCGRGDCYVVVQEKFDWKHLQLQGNDLGDHISLDKSTNVLSFTYPNIDTCIDNFLMDWERIFMMANLTRQMSSSWFEKYNEQLSFNATNLQELSFSYAKDFTCTIQWSSSSKGHPRQYSIKLGTTDDINKAKPAALPTLNSRNPHWRIASFLRDVLNDKKDLIYFVQILFQTLPLMACLERLEVECAQKGDIGKVSIIPRAYDSVRVIFSAMHAIDIRFTDKATICVSDAAYHHLYYSSRTASVDTFVAPQPYLVQAPLPSQQATEASSEGIKPIKVAQQFRFTPIDQFADLLKSMETWIFSFEPKDVDRWYVSGELWDQKTEPSAVSLQHGLLCSASLCQGILNKLQEVL
ncbi:mediator of RNA polymerase II transcription subunit 14-like [Mucor ambiguus]|uniref:Mediator of RNA polymerase II transcription subunit 14 n=1 Tax=Mucor ambiguus TaxID=91626 RepID=A0A0C9LPT3_9FUNG|nr:mediator of RNA polymerase II transcription subunit 14-like [Mucor ambiguus]